MVHTLVATADQIADRAHAHQRDKAGQPYIGHLRRVGSYVDQTNPDAVAAALLHDYLEDRAGTAADLIDAGIPQRVIAVVEALDRTNKPAEEYYAQIRQHPVALEVKLADLADNTDPDRLAQLPAATVDKLIAKYEAAYKQLGVDFNDGQLRRDRVPR
ncbi:HD domain-containing protein [Mycobacterium sp. NPDC003449]